MAPSAPARSGLVAGRRCRACRSTFPALVEKSFCPACGAFDALIDALVPPPSLAPVRRVPAVPAQKPAAPPQGPDRTHTSAPAPNGIDDTDPDVLVVEEREATRLLDVEDDDFDFFPSHKWVIDRVIGGGLVYGGVVVLGGEKGVGKTTLSTDLVMQHVLRCTCTHAQRAHRPRSATCTLCDCSRYANDPEARAFLASGEESLGRFRVRAWKRLHYSDKECARAFAKIEGCRLKNIEKVHVEAEKSSPTMIVYDSMPKKFQHPDCKLRSPDNAPKVMEEIVDFVSAIGAAALVVARLREDGQVQGGQDWLYDTDGAVTRLQRVYHPRTKEKTRYVRYTCDKNRFGREDVVGWLLQAERGLLCVNPPAFLSGRPEKFSGQ